MPTNPEGTDYTARAASDCRIPLAVLADAAGHTASWVRRVAGGALLRTQDRRLAPIVVEAGCHLMDLNPLAG